MANSIEPLRFSFTKQLTCQMASNNNMVTYTGQNLWPCKRQRKAIAKITKKEGFKKIRTYITIAMEYIMVLMFESMIEAPMMQAIKQHFYMELQYNPSNLNSEGK